jgi:hypothetical protein
MRRSVRPVLLALAAGLLVLACSGDSGNKQSSSTNVAPSGSPGAQAAASAPAPAGSPTASAVPTEPPPVPTSPEVTGALLTKDDLPAGWTMAEPTLSSGNDEVAFCNAGRAPVTRRARAEVEFHDSETHRIVNESVVSYTPGDAAKVIDFFQKSLRSCTEWQQTDDSGGEIQYQVTPLSLPKLGDGVVGARMIVTRDDVPQQVDLIALRKGDLVAYLVQSTTAGGSVDPVLTLRLLGKATERLGAAP